MRSGRLRHRLALQKATETRGAAGGVVKTFVTQATVWGGVEPIGGKEFQAIQQTQNEYTVRIVLRYRSDIDDTWRIMDTGDSPQTPYTIHSVINETKRDRMLELLCSEGVQTA